MEYLTLNNGTWMPLVGFGTFMLGGEACTNAVAAAIRGGYRMIDTATDAFRAENCAVKAENPNSSISAPYPSYPLFRKSRSGAAKAAPFRLYLIFPI